MVNKNYERFLFLLFIGLIKIKVKRRYNFEFFRLVKKEKFDKYKYWLGCGEVVILVVGV